MSSTLLDLGSRYPNLRRTLVRLWRGVWRIQRATPASAVILIRDSSGRVLVRRHQDAVQLPAIALSAWDPVRAQVECVLKGLCRPPNASLIAIDGSIGPGGVTFLFGAIHTGGLHEGGGPPKGFVWLEPNAALHCLTEADRRFLRLSDPRQQEPGAVS